MKDVFAYELISAYFDGELSDDARAEAERLLVENVEYRRWFQQLKAMRGAVAALPSYRLEADFAQKVLRRAELATLQGQGNPPASDPPPQSVTPPESAAGQGGSAVEGTAAAPRSGRSSVRWDAPLWIAVAASVCIYISLAGREPAEGPADQVALQQPAENRPMASAPAVQMATPSAAPSAFEQAAPSHATSDEAQTAGSAAYHLHEKLPLESRQLRESATLEAESSPALEGVPPGYRTPLTAKAAEPSADESNILGDEIRPENPTHARAATMPSERGVDVTRQAASSAMPRAPAARSNQADRSQALAAGAAAAELSIASSGAGDSQDDTSGMAAHGDVLIYETPGDAQTLITQFEAALTAESIVLAAPPEGQTDDHALAKRQSDKPAAEEREATSKNNQRAQTLGRAQEEVRVYVVEASDEQLARLKSRLQQLPEISLRQSQLPSAAAPASATFAGSLRAGSGNTNGISAPAADPQPTAGAAVAPPPTASNFARPATNGVGPDQAMPEGQAADARSVNGAQAKDAQAKPAQASEEQAPGQASRRAVFILRAPREAP